MPRKAVLSASDNEKRKVKIRKIIILAILTVAMLGLDIAGLGYFKPSTVMPLGFTILLYPVIIGAVLLDPWSGAFLGAVFGICSFLQCFGRSAFGALLVQIHGFKGFLVCLLPPLAAGLLAGLLFKILRALFKRKAAPYLASSLLGAILYNAFFIFLLLFFYGKEPGFIFRHSYTGGFQFIVNNLWLNILIDLATCLLIGFLFSRVALLIFKMEEHRAERAEAKAQAEAVPAAPAQTPTPQPVPAAGQSEPPATTD